jgi:hypothetical protein
MHCPLLARNPRRKGNLNGYGIVVTLCLQPPMGAGNVREGYVLKAKVRVLIGHALLLGAPQPAEAHGANQTAVSNR